MLRQDAVLHGGMPRAWTATQPPSAPHPFQGRWSPPRLGSDDDDDALFFAAADAAGPQRPRDAEWTRPRFGDDEDDEAFWTQAAALAE